MTSSEASANDWTNRTWTAGNDNLIDADLLDDPESTPIVHTYKFVVKGATATLYQKTSTDAEATQTEKFGKTMAVWPITSGAGNIHFCTGDTTTLNIDNIKVSSNADIDLSTIAAPVAETKTIVAATEAAVSPSFSNLTDTGIKIKWAADTAVDVTKPAADTETRTDHVAEPLVVVTKHIVRVFKADGTFIKEVDAAATGEAAITGLTKLTDYKVQILGVNDSKTMILSQSVVLSFTTADIAPVSTPVSTPESKPSANPTTADHSIFFVIMLVLSLGVAGLFVSKKIKA